MIMKLAKKIFSTVFTIFSGTSILIFIIGLFIDSVDIRVIGLYGLAISALIGLVIAFYLIIKTIWQED